MLLFSVTGIDDQDLSCLLTLYFYNDKYLYINISDFIMKVVPQLMTNFQFVEGNN